MAVSGFELWDIFRENSTASVITFENNRVDRVSKGSDSGIGFRGYKKGATAYLFTNDIKAQADAAARLAARPAAAGAVFKAMRGKPAFVNRVIKDPEGVSDVKKIKLLMRLNDVVRAQNSAVRQASITYSERAREIEIVNDLGVYVRETQVYTALVIMVVAARGNRIETAHSVIAGAAGFELIEAGGIEKKARDTAALAARLLKTDRRINGPMAAVISSSAGGTMIHEAVGHSLEADLVQKDLSTYKGRKGKVVASGLVTVLDDTRLAGRRGSYSFDDEGVEAQSTVLVENGVLKNFIYDRETALKDRAVSTGNGRRESYRFRPIPRMTNTMIAPGKGAAKDIIKDTKKGIFVARMGGGQVNTVTGEFVFEVKEGYLIEGGKVTVPVRGATLMGRGEEVLNTIDAVAGDLGFDSGTCGKDGQGVPVSDAQPTIRIPKILVGSK